MATFLTKRGVTETIASAITNGGSVPNDFRLPVDLMGARMAWQTIITGGPTAVTITLQASLDGQNWNTLDTSSAPGGELRFVIVQGNMGIRVASPVLTAGAAPTVTVNIRTQ